MFFIDKYSPKKIEDAIIHKNELKKLKKMSKDDSIPHIIFFGPEGSGKKTTINLFLEMIYGEDVHKTSDVCYSVTGSGNSTQQVIIKQSNYHIVIEPNNNNFDRYLIQEVVKEYAKKPPNLFTMNKNFRTVLINNVDNLSYYAQTSLRRTMENYSTICRFIMWSRSLSKVIEPLRSRCYCFRLQSPTEEEMIEILLRISSKEDINLDYNDYLKILDRANGNIKRALWLLELKQYGESIETTYDDILETIIKHILSCELKNLKYIRDLLYKIMITNISGTQIIKDIIQKLLKNNNVSFKCKIDISEIGAKYEHNLIRGRREIIHLEAFINGIMYSLADSRNFKVTKTAKH